MKRTSYLLRKFVEIRIDGGCWEWFGCVNKGGYGKTNIGSRQTTSHRLFYELEVGPIPPGAWVLHRCDNPPCVNPLHLFIGDAGINQRDCAAKRRHRMFRPGAMPPMTKLTPDKVAEIRCRMARGERQADVARTFGVCDASIHNIRRGITWAKAR